MPRSTRKAAASEDLPPYDWANNRFYDQPASVKHPDMSKMPNLKPVASHEVGGMGRMTNTLPKVSRSVARPLSRKVSR